MTGSHLKVRGWYAFHDFNDHELCNFMVVWESRFWPGMGRYVNIWNFNRLIQYYGFKHILVAGFGTMEFYDFPIILGIIIPTDELIFFRGVETTNQLIYFNIS